MNAHHVAPTRRAAALALASALATTALLTLTPPAHADPISGMDTVRGSRTCAAPRTVTVITRSIGTTTVQIGTKTASNPPRQHEGTGGTKYTYSSQFSASWTASAPDLIEAYAVCTV